MRNLDEYDVGWLDLEVRSVPVRAYSEKRLTASLQTESDWNSVSTNNSWLKTDGIGIIFSHRRFRLPDRPHPPVELDDEDVQC
ncbi:MAG TPA: hypothetical protein PKH07_20260 [bacterium]|nr:hypothetical protein [bacterium]